MTPELITSAQNPKLKRLLALQEKSRLRRSEGVFVVEGRREVEHCLVAGYELRMAFVCEEIAETPFSLPKTVEIVPVARNVYERIAYRGGASELFY